MNERWIVNYMIEYYSSYCSSYHKVECRAILEWFVEEHAQNPSVKNDGYRFILYTGYKKHVKLFTYS